MMIGKTVFEEYAPRQDAVRETSSSRSKHLSNHKLNDISFDVHAGGDRRVLRPGGRRQDRAGARHLRRGRVPGARSSSRAGSCPPRPDKVIEAGIALVPEERRSQGLFTILTIRGNVPVMNMGKISRNGFIRAARGDGRSRCEYIDKLSIATSSTEKEAAKLSGGNQQKVVFSKCLFADADLLMLDEPTRGIDVGAKSEIYGIIRRLSEEGKSIMIFSSELPEIMNICDTHLPAVRREPEGRRCGTAATSTARRSSTSSREENDVETTDAGVRPKAGRRQDEQRVIHHPVHDRRAGRPVRRGLRCSCPNFYLPQNIINLLTNNWYIIILGIGVTFLLITGNFDMSVGGIIAHDGRAVRLLLPGRQRLAERAGQRPGAALRRRAGRWPCCAPWASGRSTPSSSPGCKVPSIIVTLGTMMLARGIAQIVTRGAQRNTSLPDVFGVVGNTFHPGHVHQARGADHDRPGGRGLRRREEDGVRPANLPHRRQPRGGPALRRSRWPAPHRCCTCSAPCWPASRASCWPPSSRPGCPAARTGYEFDALVIALLGGVSIAGGFGSVLGMFVGAIILSVVTSAATGLLLSPDWQFTLKGIVTFIAILAQRFALDRRKARRA